MPATTIDPTPSSPYISPTVSSTADSATGSVFNSQPIVVASFVVELADIAVDLLTLLLLIVVIFLLLRLLHVYRRHKPSENEEGVVNIVQELAEKPVTHTSDAATQTGRRYIVISLLSCTLQMHRRYHQYRHHLSSGSSAWRFREEQEP